VPSYLFLKGGFAGAAAMTINVCALMWIRTTIYYQYRYGTSTLVALKRLYGDGGIPRFYRGLGPALIQAPLSRFGDTAANTGTLAALEAFESTRKLPVGVKTIAASIIAALFRIFLMPIDTLKTTMQVEGKNGFSKLIMKVKKNGFIVFWHGSIAAAVATFVGHYTWFFTYNTLQEQLPTTADPFLQVCRSGAMGFCSSATSDTVSNSIRVIKVYKQTNVEALTYWDALRRVLAEGGYSGLLGRGLTTKILGNGLQGLVFSVMWKYIDETLFGAKHK